MNSIFSFFTPKDKKFQPLFEQAGTNVVRISEALLIAVTTNDLEKRKEAIKEVERLEHVGDDITHTIFIELSKNFITPFDREDIHTLASALDDIADDIHAVAKKIIFYRVNPNDSGIQKMAELIEQGTIHIQSAVQELRNMKNLRKITEALVRVNDIENQADDIFDLSIEKLFNQENDFKEVIKRREIYQVLELATDKCEDAANVIESIIVKYA